MLLYHQSLDVENGHFGLNIENTPKKILEGGTPVIFCSLFDKKSF
jgi:hypothetical protein